MARFAKTQASRGNSDVDGQHSQSKSAFCALIENSFLFGIGHFTLGQ
jgi:hypothetical protein